MIISAIRLWLILSNIMPISYVVFFSHHTLLTNIQLFKSSTIYCNHNLYVHSHTYRDDYIVVVIFMFRDPIVQTSLQGQILILRCLTNKKYRQGLVGLHSSRAAVKNGSDWWSWFKIIIIIRLGGLQPKVIYFSFVGAILLLHLKLCKCSSVLFISILNDIVFFSCLYC